MSKRKRKARVAGQNAHGATPVPESPRPDSPQPSGLRGWLLAATMVLFVARPLFPSESVAEVGEGIALVMLAMLILVAWSIDALRRGRPAIRFGPTDAAVLALLAIHSIAAVFAAKTGNSREALNVLWAWVGLGAGFFLLRQSIRHPREARAAVAVMIALAVALSAYGLYQYLYELPQLRLDYARDPDAMLRAEGLLYEPGSVLRTQFDERLNSREPFATFALANSLAGYLAPWFIVAVGVVASSGNPSRARKEAVAVAVLLLLPVAACLLLTKSRSALIATAVGAGLLAVARRARPVRWRVPVAVAVVVVGLVVGVWAVGGLDAQMLSEAGKSLEYRLQYWQSTLAIIQDHPWLGCGPGQFQNSYQHCKLPEASEDVADPHNFLLEVWATAGTPALLALLAILGCFAWAVWRHSGWLGHPPTAEAVPQAQGATGVSPVDNHPADASRWVYGGALVGFLAAWPAGALGTTAPSPAVFLLGLPMAVATVLLLAGWVRCGPDDAWLAPVVIGLVVLLVNLLAAGGIGFPGVAGTFWLLLAVGLLAADASPGRSLPRAAAWAVMLLAVALAVACYWTAYRPVLAARGHMLMALSHPAQAQEHLLAAADADPAWAEPWGQLAALALENWRKNHTRESLDRFEAYTARATQCDPHSGTLFDAVGGQYFDVYQKTSSKNHVEAAIAAYGRAVALCPTHAECHAHLALALDQAGRQAAARQAAETALRLDDRMPHRDKKLPAQLRQRLLRIADWP